MSAEFLGLVAPASTFSVITKPDAFKLGFHEVAYANPITPSSDLLTVVGSSSMLQGAKIALHVLIGSFAIDGVEFIAYDLPQGACYDVVLGASLLKHFKTSVDYTAHTLTMEFLIAG